MQSLHSVWICTAVLWQGSGSLQTNPCPNWSWDYAYTGTHVNPQHIHAQFLKHLIYPYSKAPIHDSHPYHPAKNHKNDIPTELNLICTKIEFHKSRNVEATLAMVNRPANVSVSNTLPRCTHLAQSTPGDPGELDYSDYKTWAAYRSAVSPMLSCEVLLSYL